MFDAAPEEWREASFASLADYANGRAFKPEDWGKTGLPIIRIAQITNPGSETDFYYGAVEPRHLIDDGDLIFSWSATLAVVKWSGGPAVLNQHLFKVTPVEGIDRDWLQYRLEASIPDLADEAHGTTMKHIRKGTLTSKTTRVPPLDEQRRIAKVLRSVDEAISATHEVERRLRATSVSLIEELVSQGISDSGTRPTEIGDVPIHWDVVRLGDLLTIKHGFAFSSDFFLREDSGTILLTPGNFSTNKTLYFGPNTKFYDGPVPNGYVLSNGDLLVVMTDLTQDMAILGNAVLLRSDKRVLHNQRIGKVEPIDGRRIGIGFARLLLNSTNVQSAIKATASGTTVRHTSPSKILEVSVALPPLSEQVEIAKIAHEIERACDQSVVADDRSLRSETLTQLSAVKEAIASDLLSGRVRVPA